MSKDIAVEILNQLGGNKYRNDRAKNFVWLEKGGLILFSKLPSNFRR